MRLIELELTSFRNYSQQKVTFGPLTNVFFGSNGQGKTNILESIYLCTCARSHRTGKDKVLIQHNKSSYSVNIRYETERRYTETLRILYQDAVPGDPLQTRSNRLIFHNGLKLDRVSDLMGCFHAVIFAPEDVMLVKEGPSGRRRFLDLLISQIKPLYFQNLQQYSRLLSQRNKLLKMIREQEESRKDTASLTMQLDVWDLKLAQVAAAIIHQRRIFVRRLDELAGRALHMLSCQKETLRIHYRTVTGVVDEQSEAEICQHVLKRIKVSTVDDIFRGNTSQGPHRDDLVFMLNDADIKPYASQGQQRSVVLALKLAELDILREETGEKPVLLLDDVMSELDEHRRNSLLDAIADHQVCLTHRFGARLRMLFSMLLC